MHHREGFCRHKLFNERTFDRSHGRERIMAERVVRACSGEGCTFPGDYVVYTSMNLHFQLLQIILNGLMISLLRI